MENKSLRKLKYAKKKSVSSTMLINVWLEEFFNTTYEELLPNYNRNEDGEFEYSETQRFYDEHRVTQEQCDWWEKTVKEILYKKHRSKYIVDKGWWLIYLNQSPSIIYGNKLENENS